METEVANWHDADEPASWSPLAFSSTACSVYFGIIAPIFCFALKAVLLPGDAFELPGLRFISIYWIFGYGVIGLGMVTLALWLWRGARLGAWSGIVSGALLACSLFAGGLGLVLLPFSLIGLVMIIGALGFVPFLTAATFAGNSIRAFHQARRSLGKTKAWAAMLLGAVLVIGVPGSLESWVSLMIHQAIRDVAQAKPSAKARLRAWYPFVYRDQLVWSYAAESDPTRKDRLARAFRELTGEDVEQRLQRLVD